MNYIKHLTGFFNRIAMENTLNPTHISLYLTIFQCWNVNRFKNPIIISRDEMMKGSKIASNATYHKCIKELQRLGYLEYHPSFNPYSGTTITVHNFSDGYKSKPDNTTSSKNDTSSPKNEQHFSQPTEQAIGQPYIYNTKTLKNKRNIDIEPENEFLINDPILKKEKKVKEVPFELASPQKEKNEIPFAFADTEKKQTEKSRQKSSAKKEIPDLELKKEYFKFQENSEFEAERFFNYYSSNGWLIGGKTEMKDWKASARNWMLNTAKFTVNIPKNTAVKVQAQPHNLHTTINKNYDEPL
jgi:hypothetical protein